MRLEYEVECQRCDVNLSYQGDEWQLWGGTIYAFLEQREWQLSFDDGRARFVALCPACNGRRARQSPSASAGSSP